MRKLLITLSLIVQFFISGCGYTTSSLLSTEFKTIYVANCKNEINVTAEQNDLRMYRGYKPGMETNVTKAIIDHFLFDGNLKLAPEEKADLILESALTDYKRDALRYDANANVEEYRIKIYIRMSLKDARNDKILWTEGSFAGEVTYRISGPGSTSESAAVLSAINDLAQRVVERTVEAW